MDNIHYYWKQKYDDAISNEYKTEYLDKVLKMEQMQRDAGCPVGWPAGQPFGFGRARQGRQTGLGSNCRRYGGRGGFGEESHSVNDGAGGGDDAFGSGFDVGEVAA